MIERAEISAPLSGVKRSWAEIDLSQIKRNYLLYKNSIGNDVEIIAVVKANAYGHGDVAVAGALATEGVKAFAVSNIDEAIRLRRGGISGEVIVLGYTPPSRAVDIWRYGVTQTLISREYADALISCTERRLKAQFAIDTGMNRIGLDGRLPMECADAVRKYADCFQLNGVFTHLCAADGASPAEREFTRLQIKRFAHVAELIADMRLPYVHCLNSAGGLYYGQLPCHVGRIARLGIVLYGLKPSFENQLPRGILPALSWKTAVTMVKNVRAGETVGYGCAYLAEKDIRLATLSTGYADGYSRALSNVGHVLINGKKAPLVGRVCMDQMMADVSDIPNVKMGDVATLLGVSGDLSITADWMGKTVGTIGYEIVCGISERVERVYKN